MLARFFKTTPKRRMVAYLVVVLIACLGLWRYNVVSNQAQSAALQAKAIAEAEAREDEVDEARACVTAWSVREQIRDSIQYSSDGDRLALVEAIGPFARSRVNLEAFARSYAEIQQKAIERARDNLSNPECDLTEARKAIKENQ